MLKNFKCVKYNFISNILYNIESLLSVIIQQKNKSKQLQNKKKNNVNLDCDCVFFIKTFFI